MTPSVKFGETALSIDRRMIWRERGSFYFVTTEISHYAVITRLVLRQDARKGKLPINVWRPRTLLRMHFN